MESNNLKNENLNLIKYASMCILWDSYDYLKIKWYMPLQ